MHTSRFLSVSSVVKLEVELSAQEEDHRRKVEEMQTKMAVLQVHRRVGERGGDRNRW